MLSAGLQVIPFDPASPIGILTSRLLASHSGLKILHAEFIGVSGQAGTFTGFNFDDGETSLTLRAGILLTNGLAVNALGPNDNGGKTGYLGTPGDPRLDRLSDARTFDANVFTIQFTAAADVHSIQFDFVFGSEEFPVFVGAFNDTFAAFLDGRQVSFDKAGKPIAVNNNFFQLDNSKTTGFQATRGKTPVDLNIQYNGLTPALTTQAELEPTAEVHTLTFVIADAGDNVLDSGVFLADLRGGSDIDGAETGLATGDEDAAAPPETPPAPPPTPTLSPPAVDAALAIALASEEEHRRSQVFPIQFLLPDDKRGVNPPNPDFADRPRGRGQNDFALTLSSGQALPLGEIRGRVFEDYDGNGLQAANEPGLAGQTVFLDLNGNGYMDDNEPRTFTDEKGEYRFLGLTPGAYKVRQVIWSQLEPTQPPSGERLVALSYERSLVSDQNFGAVQRTLAIRPAVLSGGEDAAAPTVVAPAAPAAVSPGEAPARDKAPAVAPQKPPIRPGRKEVRLDRETPPDRRSNMCLGSLSAAAAVGWGFAASGREQKRMLVRSGERRDNAE